MSTEAQIETYIKGQPDAKRNDMHELHKLILLVQPNCRLWFMDGKDESGKVISNPNIGYGSYIIKYANGSSKEFFQIGLSANTTGISVYIMGIADKKYLAETYGNVIGKASVTGYCIKFKALKDININILEAVIRERFEKDNL